MHDTLQTDRDTLPEPELNATEARIVASLVEKEATTPDTYPLTLNAIVVACNQKTAREPVLQLEPGEVGHALRQLEERGWVKSQYAARADRYAHRVEGKLGLSRAHTALLALLMLRGPQTLNELLTRCERLAKFENVDDVHYALVRLSQREAPLVRMLARQGGQREDRYAHLLSGEPVYFATAGNPGTTSRSASPAAARAAIDADANTGSPATAALEERVSALEARLATLEFRISGRGAIENSETPE